MCVFHTAAYIIKRIILPTGKLENKYKRMEKFKIDVNTDAGKVYVHRLLKFLSTFSHPVRFRRLPFRGKLI